MMSSQPTGDMAALVSICCRGKVGDGGLSVCLCGGENGGRGDAGISREKNLWCSVVRLYLYDFLIIC